MGSYVTRFVREHFRGVSLVFFIGFGLSSCSGQDAEEPVQVDEAMAEQATAEGEAAAVDATLDSAMDMPSEGILTEEGVGIDDGLMPSDTMTAFDEAPEGVMAPDMGAVESEGIDEVMVPQFGSEPDMGLAASDVGLDQTTGAAQVAPSAANYDGDTGDYKIEAGDTLVIISKKIYRTSKHWAELASANGIGAPYTIFVGRTLRYPLLNGAAKAFAANGGVGGGDMMITVKKGDTLSALASQIWGSARQWPRLYEMNRDKISDPNRIDVGLVLRYSGGKESAAVKAPASGKNVATTKPLVNPQPVTQPLDGQLSAMNHNGSTGASVEAAAEQETVSAFEIIDDIPLDDLEADIDSSLDD